MSIALAHGKEQTLQHLRSPGYLLPTLAMPGLFYFLFEGPDTEAGLVTFLMASYAMWAILGVAFFQFGVGIAEQRTTPWERFLRTLPLSAGQRLAGRVLSAALFAAAAAAVVIAEAHLINPVSVAALDPGAAGRGCGGGRWGDRPGVLGQPSRRHAPGHPGLAAGRLPGWAVGHPYRAPELGGGGLPVPAHPPVGRGDLGGGPGPATELGDWLGLVAWAVGFTFLALWGYRRDEGTSYR